MGKYVCIRRCLHEGVRHKGQVCEIDDERWAGSAMLQASFAPLEKLTPDEELPPAMRVELDEVKRRLKGAGYKVRAGMKVAEIYELYDEVFAPYGGRDAVKPDAVKPEMPPELDGLKG